MRKENARNSPGRDGELSADPPEGVLRAIAHREHDRGAPRKALEHPSAEDIEIPPGDVDEDV